MDTRLVSIATLLAVVAFANGHVFRLGDCPNVEVQKDFEMKKVRNHFQFCSLMGVASYFLKRVNCDDD